MTYNPDIHHRRSIRLKDYDYSQAGAYYVTICVHNKSCLLGAIADGKMMLNEFGEVVKQCWLEIPEHFTNVKLDVFVIMPNHVHGVMFIQKEGANSYSPLQKQGTSRTVGSIVRGFKIGVTKWVRQNTMIHTVWQRNYYEHVIRNKTDYERIAEYIAINPQKWAEDSLHPSAIAGPFVDDIENVGRV